MGRADPHARGRAMGEYSEAFVAFDVAKKKHAVAIAEGGRTGEVRLVGEVENSPAAIAQTIKKLGKKCTSPWIIAWERHAFSAIPGLPDGKPGVRSEIG